MDETPAFDAAPDTAADPAADPAAAGQPSPGQQSSGQQSPGQAHSGPPYGEPYAQPYAQPGYAPSAAPTGMDGFFASIRRTGMVRTDERWIGGVAGGVAMRLGIDPLIVRGLFGVAALLGGVGLVLYGLGWLLLPEQRDGRIHLQQLFGGDFDAAVVGGFALLLMGFAFPNRWFGWGDGNGWFGGVVSIVVIGVIIAVIVSSSSRRRAGPPAGPWAPSAPATSPTTLRPGEPYYSASVPPAAPHRPEGSPMYPAPPAPGAPYAASPQGSPWPGQPYRQGPPMPATVPMPPARPMPPLRPMPPGRPMPPMPPSGPVTSLRHSKPRGPGGRVVGIVFSLTLITLAALLYAEREGHFDGPVLLTTAAALVIMCGIGIAAAGVMGRTSGGLGAVAIIAIIASIPGSLDADFTFGPGDSFAGDGRFTPQTVVSAEDGYSWMVGDVVVDLTALPPGADVAVPIHMGGGDVSVVLPQDAAYTVRAKVNAGTMSFLGEEVMSGVGNGWQTFDSPAVQNGDDPTLSVEVSVGAGQLTVEEQ